MIRQELNISKGTVLLASPFMDDPNFNRAAILICSHNEEGTMGFVFNKPMVFPLNDVLESFPTIEVLINRGGPVENNTLHFLHNAGSILDDSIPICPGIYWSGDFKKLKFLIKSELITPKDIRFFAGYAGWDKGQLEEEFMDKSWIISNMDANYLFKMPQREIWKKMIKSNGGHYPPLAEIPDDYSWN